MSQELTTINGTALYRASTDAATLCKDIVVATATKIGGKKYVQVEGWKAIALAHGCVASASGVERVEGGFRAIGHVVNMTTGKEISFAEGFVGDDEKTWANRPEYAKRAMAQTRAMSRACRSAFAHVVVMMNAGLQTTPAEEVPENGFSQDTKFEVVEKPDDAESKKKATEYAEAIDICPDEECLENLVRQNAVFASKLATELPAWHSRLIAKIEGKRASFQTREAAE
ncbi:MAG: hypothetical protein KGL39_48645 [Patescibacteria group bacterium]|nr:hypothetical protein [Patescibacteria group bacterium]